MNSTTYRQHLARLGISQLAARLIFNTDKRTARRWASGDQPIPEAVAHEIAGMTQTEAQDLLLDEYARRNA